MNSKHSTLLSMSYQNIFWGVCFNSWSTQQHYNINFKKFSQQNETFTKKEKKETIYVYSKRTVNITEVC